MVDYGLYGSSDQVRACSQPGLRITMSTRGYYNYKLVQLPGTPHKDFLICDFITYWCWARKLYQSDGAL